MPWLPDRCCSWKGYRLSASAQQCRAPPCGSMVNLFCVPWNVPRFFRSNVRRCRHLRELPCRGSCARTESPARRGSPHSTPHTRVANTRTRLPARLLACGLRPGCLCVRVYRERDRAAKRQVRWLVASRTTNPHTLCHEIPSLCQDPRPVSAGFPAGSPVCPPLFLVSFSSRPPPCAPKSLRTTSTTARSRVGCRVVRSL